jgi:alpha-glucosidase
VNAEQERTLNIDLDFLEERVTYTAEIYRDGDDAHWESNPYAVTIETKTFKKGDVFKIRLASGGGFGAIFNKNVE